MTLGASSNKVVQCLNYSKEVSACLVFEKWIAPEQDSMNENKNAHREHCFFFFYHNSSTLSSYLEVWQCSGYWSVMVAYY